MDVESKFYFPVLIILPIVIVLEGFVSIATEILTIRQLLPVAGGSVVVTSLIIGIFLLFLALGYHQGGKNLDNPRHYLRRNFIVAACWLGIGLSYPFVEVFFNSIESVLGPHLIYPLITYLLIIIAPLIYLLGQTVPIAMNMVRQNQTAGKIGSKTLFLSTIGSFLGAVLTTIILLQYFGVAFAVFFNASCLYFLGVLLAKEQRSLIIELIVFILFCIGMYIFNVQAEKIFFQSTNSYANYQILSHDNAKLDQDEKILVINNGLSSYVNADLKGFKYIEVIKQLLFYDLKLREKNILVLGAGGFSLSAENVFQNNFTYVDIDKNIKAVAVPKFRKNFFETFIADDARHFLKVTPKKYAAVVVDVYSDIKSIPAHLLTEEYMRAIKRVLESDATIVFNIIANPLFKDRYSKRIDNTIRSVFSACNIIPQRYSNKPTNIIYVCQNNQQTDATIYRDNLNSSTTDSFSW